MAVSENFGCQFQVNVYTFQDLLNPKSERKKSDNSKRYVYVRTYIYRTVAHVSINETKKDYHEIFKFSTYYFYI